jgi:hypothetical protein
MKYHQDMTRCIFRIFKTTKADEGLRIKFNLNKFQYLFYSGEYTCQIDDEQGIKTTGYLYVEGIEYINTK